MGEQCVWGHLHALVEQPRIGRSEHNRREVHAHVQVPGYHVDLLVLVRKMLCQGTGLEVGVFVNDQHSFTRLLVVFQDVPTGKYMGQLNAWYGIHTRSPSAETAFRRIGTGGHDDNVG